jgi:hypothetical protein
MQATAIAAQVRCRRPGCKGILRTEESIARGMSKACDRKVRQAEAIAAKAGYSADQQAKAAAAIRSGEVTVEGPGLYGVPSSKNDGTRYATDGRSCVCAAGAKDRRCWHLLIPIVLDLAFPVRRPAVKAAVASDAIWAALEATGALDLVPAF